jgi:hypothetical protein
MKKYKKCPICECDDERYSYMPRNEESPSPMEIECQRCGFLFVENGKDDIDTFIQMSKKMYRGSV